MEPNPRTFTSLEAGIAHAKIDGVVRLVAIISAFIFWYLIAIVLLALHIGDALPYSSLVSFAQAVTTAGLLPIPVALVTWKFFEWLYAKYLTGYAKKYFQHSRS